MRDWLTKPVGFKRTDQEDMALHDYTTKVSFTDITKQWWKTVYDFTNGNPNDTYKIYKLLEDFKEFINGSSSKNMVPEPVLHNITQFHTTSHEVMQRDLHEITQNHITSSEIIQSAEIAVTHEEESNQFVL